MSAGLLDTARDALIECCRYTGEGILECVDLFTMSSRSVYEMVSAQFSGLGSDHIHEETSHVQRSTAGRIEPRSRGEMPKVRFIAERDPSRRRTEIPMGSGQGSSVQVQIIKLRVADYSVTTKSDKEFTQAQPKQNTRLQANAFPHRNHEQLNDTYFRKQAKSKLDMFTKKNVNDHICVTEQSDAFPNSKAWSFKTIESHEEIFAHDMRDRRSAVPSQHSKTNTYEQSLKCNVSASFEYGLSTSKHGNKTNTAKYVFSKMAKQKSNNKTIKQESTTDTLNKEMYSGRSAQDVRNEKQLSDNTSYYAISRMSGDVRSTLVDPKNILDLCKEAGYDPSTLVPSMSFYSNAKAEQNKAHFQNLKSILRQIQTQESIEQIAYNKVKAMCHNRTKLSFVRQLKPNRKKQFNSLKL
ncbi:hypothetical protein DPMN_015526 [Dreissena polymorpha]|uniref:Uncharacterized protein n=1 Tax=Dreissena polymorpha TaxID=45954 RepID=A0A9D4NB70_DREPO|nr:hypothetical protein DPMN_015526 [Dreissena polymorpha]